MADTAPPSSSHTDPPNAPVIQPGHTFATVGDSIASIVLERGGGRRGWIIGFGVSFALLMVFFYAVGNLLIRGIGIWGVNQPVAWGFAIINFVWWIGIGHAGTLISAVLLLLRQDWRTSINRFAEAMTLFAVACAGMYPILHIGRVWLFYWLFPYPNTMSIWPNFRSPLLFDVFAVSTYAGVSAMFWYVGLVPDMATLRDRAKGKLARMIYGAMALGWRGSTKHWHNYETAYLLLAGLATPLVVSVHTIVSFDFAVAQVPGWHATVFPPYFVAGAIYAGFAMVLTLAIPIRHVYKLKDFITDRHLQNMAKVMLVTGWVVGYGYLSELFFAWYSASPAEAYMAKNRMTGPYAPAFWGLFLTNIGIPQLLWIKKVRTHTGWLLFVAMSVNIGMWLERFVIVVISLHRDYMPSAWGMYEPTVWDWATYAGTIGLFFTLMFLFLRFLPLISIFEVRTLLPGAHAAHADDEDDEDDEPRADTAAKPEHDDDASDDDDDETDEDADDEASEDDDDDDDEESDEDDDEASEDDDDDDDEEEEESDDDDDEASEDDDDDASDEDDDEASDEDDDDEAAEDDDDEASEDDDDEASDEDEASEDDDADEDEGKASEENEPEDHAADDEDAEDDKS